MGVYINGMETPRKCIRCPVNVYGRCLVNDDKDVSKATADAVRDKDCPLVPVPPHGDLIDRDALTISTAVPLDGKPYQYVHIDNIKAAPTVIPAEEGE